MAAASPAGQPCHAAGPPIRAARSPSRSAPARAAGRRRRHTPDFFSQHRPGRGQQRPRATVPDEDRGLAGRAIGDHPSLAQVIRRPRRDRASQIGNGHRVSVASQVTCDWPPGPAADQWAMNQQQPSLHALTRITDAADARRSTDLHLRQRLATPSTLSRREDNLMINGNCRGRLGDGAARVDGDNVVLGLARQLNAAAAGEGLSRPMHPCSLSSSTVARSVPPD